MADKNIMLDAAIEYASKGLAVFPLKPKGKAPITKNGVKNATTDERAIRKWWEKNPKCNIGIACGKISGGLTVIDLDEKEDGTSGLDSLKEWEALHGEFPETARSLTGGGGTHLFYRLNHSVKNSVGILPGIDIRSDGGYIVAPPSVHESGRSYEWEYDIEEYEISDANESVLALLENDKKQSESASRYSLPEVITDGTRNNHIFSYASSLQRRGLDDSEILQLVIERNRTRCNPPLPDNEVQKLVKHVTSDYPKGNQGQVKLMTYIDKSGNEKPYQNIENWRRVLTDDPKFSGKIREDVFNHRISYFGQHEWKAPGDTFGEWRDSDDSEVKNSVSIDYGLHQTSKYDDAFRIVTSRNPLNPLTSFLDALEWDGRKRIEIFMTEYLGVESTRYNQTAIHIFLQGAMHRAYKPGSKFDYMLVLIGAQGSGKSTFFKYLACNDEWYNDNFNPKVLDSKTAVEQMNGKWILEMAEMDTLKKDSTTADSMKAFISSQTDVYRTPFNKRPETRKRHCVFCGTSNDVNFLKDRTGNRRYLPVDVHPEKATKSIWNENEARSEFLQVVAEAVAYYKEHPDEKPILPKDLEEEAARMQFEHLEEDSWVNIINDYLSNTTRSRVNALCIWVNAFGKDKADLKRAHISRILTIMRHDIKGWHDIGKNRCEDFGEGSICFERDARKVEEMITGTIFQPVDSAEQIPF